MRLLKVMRGTPSSADSFMLTFWRLANCVVNLLYGVSLDCGLSVLDLSFSLPV